MAALAMTASPWLASPAPAQDPGGAPPETYENQPPLTDDDVPALTEFLIDLDGNTRRWDEIVSKYGLHERRIAYIVNKYIGGMWLLDPESGFTEESVAEYMGTPLAVPTPEELQAIRRNSGRIETARRDAERVGNDAEDGDEDGGDGPGDDGGAGKSPSTGTGEAAPDPPAPAPPPSGRPARDLGK
jgi:hypothetical protein